MEKVFSPKLFGLIKDGSVKKNLSKDILAGIVVGIVALPLAIAFAVASSLESRIILDTTGAEKGIITAIVAGFLISFFGGSRVQIGGPTGAFIIIVYGIVNDYGLDGMIISTIFAGVIMIGFGMLRLGTLLKFIPHPLIVGFTSGIALTIFSTQISSALGLTLTDVPGSFIGKWGAYFGNRYRELVCRGNHGRDRVDCGVYAEDHEPGAGFVCRYTGGHAYRGFPFAGRCGDDDRFRVRGD